MSIFKSKPSKVKLVNEQGTLDEIHKQTIEKFNDGQKLVEQNKKKIYLLNQKLNQLQSNYEENYRKINSIKNKIKMFENMNTNLSVLNDDLNYFIKTGDILLNYYKDENKIDVDEINDDQYDDVNINIKNNDSKDSLSNKYLDELSSTTGKKQVKSKKYKKKQEDDNITGNILNFLTPNTLTNSEDTMSSIVIEKGTLKNQYLMLTDPTYVCKKIKLPPIKICPTCDIEQTLIQSEGIFVCQKCGKFEYVIIESEIPSHKDSANDKPKYPYKTINHLIERLNQFQGKQTTVIPKDIYDLVDVEIKKMLVDKDDITPNIIKRILKKYRLSTYYEHSYLIFSTITGIPLPSLTRDEHEIVVNMAKATQKPYQIYKSEDRSNYLNTSYTLHKIFLILADFAKKRNDDEVYTKMMNNVKYHTLLKSRDKLKLQDLTWRKICSHLDWPYHPSF